MRSFASLGLLGMVWSACGDDGEGTTRAGSTTSATAGSTTSSGTGTGGAGGAASCGPAPGQPSNPACKACTNESCCAAAQACAEDPPCNELASCVEACGDDDACYDEQCLRLTQMGPGSPAFFDLSICQLESCKTECNVQPVCEDLQYIPDPDSACTACHRTECCDETQAGFTVDYLELAKCFSTCLDVACTRDCELLHPEAMAAQDELNTCLAGPPCDTACEGDEVCGLIAFVEGPCSTCTVASCCDAFDTCSQSQSCLDYLTCFVSCGPQGTCDQCAALWPPEIAGLFLAGSNCLENHCNVECGGFPPGCGLGDQLDPPDCQTCLRASCCAEASACGEDATCAALKICSTLCAGDTTCEASCEAQFPSAVTAHDVLLACKAASCAADCP